jgi:diguanylate cyclase (GGDEF)-like protein
MRPAPKVAGRVSDAARLAEQLVAVMPHASAYAFDREARLIVARGPAFERHGLPAPSRLAGRLLGDILPTGSWPSLREHVHATLRGEQREFEYPSADGRSVYRVHFAPLAGEDGEIGGGLAVAHDLGPPRNEAAPVERHLRHQAAVVDIAARALALHDPKELSRFACERVAHSAADHGVVLLDPGDDGRLGLSAVAGLPDAGASLAPSAAALGRALRERSPVVLDVGPRAAVAVEIEDRDSPGALVAVFPDGNAPDALDLRYLSAVAAVLSAARDRHRHEDELRHAALHDALTGLPNRAALRDHLRLGLARNARYATKLAIFFLDLDDFKDVNDAYGHGVGDALLRQVAERLQIAVRRADLVARLGGDEFVLVCETIAGEQEIACIAERIRGAFAEPFALDGTHERLNVSIGVSVVGRETSDPDAVLDRADAEMYRAKRERS